jgi:hypothetical protein
METRLERMDASARSMKAITREMLNTTMPQASIKPEHIRDGQVYDQVNQIQDAIDMLAKAIDGLWPTLKNVLTDPTPNVMPTSPTPPDECLVPLADSLRNIRRCITNNTERIHGILRRVEV